MEDESKLAELIAALPDPVNMMLALANRTGLRLGEVCGLRLSDLDTIPKGFLTVSHSYANPLKEDRRGVGKVKKAPAPVDVADARAAKADVPIEQISKSLGHASTEITEKHYVQFQREDFHPALRLPMLPLLAPKKKKTG